MKNFYIEINGIFFKDYQNGKSAYKNFLLESRNKNNIVNLYESKAHAFGSCASCKYVLTDSSEKFKL